jgi:hypothetical protein
VLVWAWQAEREITARAAVGRAVLMIGGTYPMGGSPMLVVGRRNFIALLGGAAAAWPIAAGAQQPVRVKRIGLMANLQLRPIEGFRNRLRELGYIEGQNLIVEYRFAGRFEGDMVRPADMSGPSFHL